MTRARCKKQLWQCACAPLSFSQDITNFPSPCFVQNVFRRCRHSSNVTDGVVSVLDDSLMSIAEARMGPSTSLSLQVTLRRILRHFSSALALGPSAPGPVCHISTGAARLVGHRSIELFGLWFRRPRTALVQAACSSGWGPHRTGMRQYKPAIINEYQKTSARFAGPSHVAPPTTPWS